METKSKGLNAPGLPTHFIVLQNERRCKLFCALQLSQRSDRLWSSETISSQLPGPALPLPSGTPARCCAGIG